MFEGKAVIGETDMPMRMQQHAMCYAAQALAMIESSDCQQIARSLKQEFDKCYGGGWQCIVGKQINTTDSSTELLKIYNVWTSKAIKHIQNHSDADCGD